NELGRRREFAAYGGKRGPDTSGKGDVRFKPDQPVAANIDQVLLLYAVDRPRPNFEKVDTALVMALSQGVPAVLCFNKLDLATDNFRRELEGYRRLAIPVLTVSALNGDGFDALMPLFVGKTTLLWGPSGVGKSTLLNRVIP